MPLLLFGSASFIGLTVLTLLLYGDLGGLLLLVPDVLIEARVYSATMARAALLPLALVIAITPSQMGKLAARTRASARCRSGRLSWPWVASLPLALESRAVIGRRHSTRY